jgi:HAD superfamily hydrolase (TIGR01509 family)
MSAAAMPTHRARSGGGRGTVAAALFDWDGTLIDSRAALLAAWRESTSRVLGRAYPATPAEQRTVFTLPGAQIWSQLASDDDELAALAASFQESYERYADGVCAFPGVREMLERLRAAAVSIAVVTSKARRRYGSDIAHAGLEGVIDAAICAEDAVRAKPDPGPVVRALEQLGVAGALAIMVGDTPVDMAAGIAAGTRTMGVAWGHASEAELLAAGAEAVARNPGEVLVVVLAGERPRGRARTGDTATVRVA